MTRYKFKKLKIWQEGADIVVKTYEITSTFPSKEKYGLASQLNPCAVSIPSNIAEGKVKVLKNILEPFLKTVLDLLLNGKHKL